MEGVGEGVETQSRDLLSRDKSPCLTHSISQSRAHTRLPPVSRCANHYPLVGELTPQHLITRVCGPFLLPDCPMP
ncbi:hypothetical protein XELAEV_18043005mg [Xenopus laevis]|uniref:Uncharacterized protein n=1 Tax=Xenopus laevis TaxID=8355 RepID=A0A974H6J0_XENLA|nr:hypothetical protein XELAEV_18043005mg [Xenopus laevis]